MSNLRPVLKLSPLLFLAVAACGHSPATQFYTLDALPGHGQPASPAPLLRVDQVQVPAVLDRPQLVHEYAQGQLKVDEFSHWGAPLGQLMRTTLTQDLAARLPSGNLAPGAGPGRPGTIGISVEIVSVDSSASGMTMDVVWTASVAPPPPAKGQAQSPSPVITSHTSRLTTPESASIPAGYAAGLSSLMAGLADEIVATTSVAR